MAAERLGLIAVIGEEAFVMGMLLAGVGERTGEGNTNFFVVDANTHKDDVVLAFEEFLERPDVSLILVSQFLLERDLKQSVQRLPSAAPPVVGVPSSEFPYRPQQDPLVQLVSAKVFR